GPLRGQIYDPARVARGGEEVHHRRASQLAIRIPHPTERLLGSRRLHGRIVEKRRRWRRRSRRTQLEHVVAPGACGERVPVQNERPEEKIVDGRLEEIPETPVQGHDEPWRRRRERRENAR